MSISSFEKTFGFREVIEPKRKKTRDVWGHVEVRRGTKEWEADEDILVVQLTSGDQHWFETICSAMLDVVDDLLHSYTDAQLVRLTVHVYRQDPQGRNRTFRVTHIADRTMIGEVQPNGAK